MTGVPEAGEPHVRHATPTFTATVRVTGEPEQLDAFAERVRWLMVRDVDAERYTEHHERAQLEYRFELDRGIPFPVFATASGDLPGTSVLVEWIRGEQSGRAVLVGGRLIERELR